MITGDMQIKREIGIEKVRKAIDAHHGTTLLMASHLVGIGFPPILKASVDAGVRMYECAGGILEAYSSRIPVWAADRDMLEMVMPAYRARGERPIEEVAQAVKHMRSIVPEDVYITVPAPGLFTEVVPIQFTEQDALALSVAGADGLHVHKSTMEDLEDIVKIAHKYGLLVDAYIAHPSDALGHIAYLGIPAHTPKDVSKAAEDMERIGVDMIGLLTGMTYVGLEAGEITQEVRERFKALVDTSNVPTIAEGGITSLNFKGFKETGVSIMVTSTPGMTEIARSAVVQAIRTYLGEV